MHRQSESRTQALRQRQWLRAYPRSSCSLDVLHRDEVRAIDFTNFVDVGNVWMGKR